MTCDLLDCSLGTLPLDQGEPLICVSPACFTVSLKSNTLRVSLLVNCLYVTRVQ